ncbi:MAG TPA: type II CAAX endopeptidase family protein [Pseudonocardia sp.]|jgi:membrane protease YdiL (CAAX protease family)|nr:type II CAAX endopeptidase family protein [Pseudonocardia sp.]
MTPSSSSASSDRRQSGRVVRVLRERQLLSFFVLAYGITWLLWSPVLVLGLPVFSASTHAPTWYLMPAIIVGVTGSAFFMTAVTQGRPGMARLLRRLVTWRVGVVWFAVAILLIPVGEVVGAVALGAPDALGALTPSGLVFYPAAYAAHFFFGPLFEESGWRGFALPRMQQRFGPLKGTILLGLLWSGWHFFLYAPTWFSGGAVAGVAGILVFTVTTTAMTFIFTWLSNNTRASLLLCVLLHGSVDGTATYLQVLADRGVISDAASGAATQFGLLAVCLLVAVLLAVATRGRLSYPRYREEAESLDLPPTPREPVIELTDEPRRG